MSKSDVIINNRMPEAKLRIMDRAKTEFRQYINTMKELARRPPPEGSPIAGVFDPRLPPKPRKLIGLHGGKNRNSIQYTEKTSGDSIAFEIFTTSNYGAYLEFGTSKMVDRPYFAPSHAIAQAEFISRTPWL
jgi:hypothetical protein